MAACILYFNRDQYEDEVDATVYRESLMQVSDIIRT